jgi:hypothetical protein
LRAAATARSTSAALPCAMDEITSAVAGLCVSKTCRQDRQDGSSGRESECSLTT